MSYCLKQTKQKSGRIYLEIIDSIYNKSKGYSIPKIIEKLGYLDELEKTYVDPVSHFKSKAKEMELNRKKMEEEAIPYNDIDKRLGYFMYKNVLDKLNLAPLFKTFDRESNAQYKTKEIFDFLTYSRVINPGSKIENYRKNINSYFEEYHFSDSQMYDGLQKIGKEQGAVIEYLNDHYEEVYGKRDLSKVYFDCTNYYFEIDADNYTYFKQPGPSKENHEGAIIGLGLLLDGDAIPYTYKLYPGNQSEKPIQREVIKDMKATNEIQGRTIRVADKGLNCAENIIDAINNNDGYIYSRQVKRIKTEERNCILSKEGWTDVFTKLSDEDIKNGKTKEYLYSVKVWDDNYEYEANDQKVTVHEKRIVIYSPKYAKKERLEREKMIANAENKTLGSYKRDALGTATKFFDIANEDGSILKTRNVEFIKRESEIKESEEMDGLYMIVTSERNLPYEKIREIYSNLWEIEESFRLSKTQFEARPIYVSLLDAIYGHFLTCYMALFLTRVIQKKELENKYSASAIIEFARSLKAYPIDNKKYHLTGGREIIKDYERKYKVTLNKNTQTSKEINNFFLLK